MQSESAQWRQSPDGSWWFMGPDGQWHPSSTPVGPLTAQPAPEAATDSTLPAGAWIAIAGGVLMGVSAFLPWMTAYALFGSLNRNSFQLGSRAGFSADGLVLVALGVLTVVVGVTRLIGSAMPKYLQRSTIVTGIGVLLLVINRAPSINSLSNQVGKSSKGMVSASIGYGLWVAAAAGVIAVVGGIILRSQPKGPGRLNDVEFQAANGVVLSGPQMVEPFSEASLSTSHTEVAGGNAVDHGEGDVSIRDVAAAWLTIEEYARQHDEIDLVVEGLDAGEKPIALSEACVGEDWGLVALTDTCLRWVSAGRESIAIPTNTASGIETSPDNEGLTVAISARGRRLELRGIRSPEFVAAVERSLPAVT